MKKTPAILLFSLCCVLFAAEKSDAEAAVPGHARQLWDRLVAAAQQLFGQDMVFSCRSVTHGVLWMGLVVLCVLSGAFAVRVARRKLRHPLPFFLAGAVLPVIGPLILQFTVSAAADSADEDNRSASQSAEEPWDGVMNQNYFRRIALKSDGTPNGPWMIAYNGSHVRMLEILETEADFMKARIRNHAGEVLTARIPYVKIESLSDITNDTKASANHVQCR